MSWMRLQRTLRNTWKEKDRVWPNFQTNREENWKYLLRILSCSHSVVKNCVEYSMNLFNRNKHKLENEKKLERKNSANKDKKIIKTYYQYIAIFTKNSLHFLNIFFNMFCTKFLVGREISEKLLSSDKITSIFRSQKYWKRFYTASLLLKPINTLSGLKN